MSVMEYTNINDADEVVVRKITEVAAPHASADVEDGWYSGLTAGKFLGLNSDFNAVEADARASVGPIYALGVSLYDVRNSWTIGTNLTGNRDFKRVDMYEDNITIQLDGGPTLTPGPIWLSSGGGITQEYPNTVGDIRQQVAWAIDSDTFVVNVQDAVIVGAGGA